ncbi:hypothetical protein F8O01_11930 [Pseudoclavibacter chungangensis]|uniref:Uncharacterized protein n=1 Tax=Pseudoclavibacter chungangensis TaxID=587635 RepID=A0A7J5BPX4_9MICO|nr:hypothetical protein F8O01_11930 [Pseudoclavibacter chungangensis]
MRQRPGRRGRTRRRPGGRVRRPRGRCTRGRPDRRRAGGCDGRSDERNHAARGGLGLAHLRGRCRVGGDRERRSGGVGGAVRHRGPCGQWHRRRHGRGRAAITSAEGTPRRAARSPPPDRRCAVHNVGHSHVPPPGLFVTSS